LQQIHADGNPARGAVADSFAMNQPEENADYYNDHYLAQQIIVYYIFHGCFLRLKVAD
jgi:hypothetical protein